MIIANNRVFADLAASSSPSTSYESEPSTSYESESSDYSWGQGGGGGGGGWTGTYYYSDGGGSSEDHDYTYFSDADNDDEWEDYFADLKEEVAEYLHESANRGLDTLTRPAGAAPGRKHYRREEEMSDEEVIRLAKGE